MRGICAALLGIVLAPVCASAAQITPPADNGPDLTQITIEDLASVKFTTASRGEQHLFDIAAPAFVITQEDIRRSGAVHLAEVLRMAPGVQVAQIDQNKWAVSMRGFNGRFANKLLVLVDGQSVYSPAFSGVLWETLDIPLSEIERIEVIRGPGGALWGANAVNGIINILTSNASQASGVEVRSRAADHASGSAELQYGGRLGPGAHYRVYGKFDGYGTTPTPSGADGQDGWNGTRGGFRVDWNGSGSNQFMLHGSMFDGHYSEYGQITLPTAPYHDSLFDRYRLGTADLMGRWTSTDRSGAEQITQLSWGHLTMSTPQILCVGDTFDADWQRKLPRAGSHAITLGAGYRVYSDDLRDRFVVSATPAASTLQTTSTFIEDEISIAAHLRATLGTKLELNGYTGFEYQPSARLAWTPDDNTTVWTSVARAVRTPSREDRDISVVGGGSINGGGVPVYYDTFGNPRFRSERVLSYEFGYRTKPAERVSLDLACFYNSYDYLRYTVVGQPGLVTSPDPRIVVPIQFQNLQGGHNYGLELQANWRVCPGWRLSGSYSYCRTHLRLPDDGDSMAAPEHQAVLRSMIDLRRSLELDTSVFVVGRQAYETSSVPGYIRLDMRLGWRPRPCVELALGAMNLLDARHIEFGSINATSPHQIERTVYGSVTWRP